jgi:chemotaxis signal transduction protein
MIADSPYCLFHHKTDRYALAVETVAEIIEIPPLVRIGLCPPVILGLCPFHREVVPVVALEATSGRKEAVLSAQLSGRGKAREAVLIVQSSQGAWGITVEREGTLIVLLRATRHEPRRSEGGAVTMGLIHHEDAPFALIDPEATWRCLREAVSDWYRRIGVGASRMTVSPTAIP